MSSGGSPRYFPGVVIRSRILNAPNTWRAVDGGRLTDSPPFNGGRGLNGCDIRPELSRIARRLPSIEPDPAE